VEKRMSQKEESIINEPIITKSNIAEEESSAVLVIGQSQDIGKRGQQQDAYGFNFGDKAKGSLFIVADGMGGMEFGDVASQFAVDYVTEHFGKQDSIDDIPTYFTEILKTVNTQVVNFAQQRDLAGGVGTTFVGIIIVQNKLFWVSVGDSHIYLFKNNYLTLLSYDHIYANKLAQKVKQKEISLKESLSNPEKSYLTSYLGVKELTEIDYNITPYTLEKGDKIVLCSDGIYGVISEAEFCDHLQKEPQTCTNDLVKTILSKNIDSQDNMTIITIEYKGE